MRVSVTIFLLVIACLISGCEEVNNPEANPVNYLEGKWSCTFAYLPEMDTLLTFLEFKGDSFFVVIDKPENIFPLIINDSLTMHYKGTYETITDTMRFFISGDEPFMEDYTFSMSTDSMQIRTRSYVSQGIIIIRMASFLWANKVGTTEGTFVKVE